LLILFGLILALTLVLFFPYEWLSKKTHEFRDSARAGVVEPGSKVIEVMTDFHFSTDETKWIGQGRKTKRIHVVDKANQVQTSQTCKNNPGLKCASRLLF
jgi:hypothetical protein